MHLYKRKCTYFVNMEEPTGLVIRDSYSINIAIIKCSICAQKDNVHTGPDKDFFHHKIVTFFLSINLNMCFGFSKEPPH